MVCSAGSGDSDQKAVLVGTKLGFPTWRAVGLAVKQQPLPAHFQGFNPSFQGHRALPTLFGRERSRDRRDKPNARPFHEARSRSTKDSDELMTSASLVLTLCSSRTTKARPNCLTLALRRQTRLPGCSSG
ncbi:hypothetical protein ILYODFUR_007569 [Ilyodon furcidens]|uniref:Uncharacterized protein n=1 Tax=Ilyodon furcidens TaxID=33524 RepID=A0ABV0VED4_9TELE